MEKEGIIKDVSQSLNFIARGVKPTSKPLFPISSHYGEVLFNTKKLKEYFIDKNKVIYETYAYSKEVSGESFKEAVQNYGGNFHVEGSGTYGAASFSGSVSAEFNMQSSETQEMKFSQIRKIAQYAKMLLPKPLLREQLRGLVEEEVLQAIDSVENLDDAKAVIDCFGPFYLDSIILGALLTISSKKVATESNSSQDLSTSLTADISYMTSSANAKAGFQMGTNTGKKNKDLTYTIAALGGEPSLILNGDETSWIKSAAQNLAAIDATFAPIYNIAKKNSNSEKLIKDAYNLEVEKKKKELETFSKNLTVKKSAPVKKDLYTIYITHEETMFGSTTKGNIKILLNSKDVFCARSLDRDPFFAWRSKARNITNNNGLGENNSQGGLNITEDQAYKLKNI